jgi:hypothetical protein
MRKFEDTADYPLTVANDESHDLGPGLRRWMPMLYEKAESAVFLPAVMAVGIVLCLVARWVR